MGWITPENFKGDWYGWATNQLSHVLIGLFAAILTTLAWWGIFGEYPYRLPLAIVLMLVFVASELKQGWNGGDAFEDLLFRGYGVAFILGTLHEVQRFALTLEPDVGAMLTIIVVASVHLAVGAGIRLWQKLTGRA